MAAWVVQSGRSQMMDLGVGYCVGHNKRPHGSGTKKRYSPTQPNKSLESGCHGCRFYCFLPSRHKTHKTWEGTSGMHLKKMDWEATASCREKTQNRTSWTTGFGQRCSPLKFRFINFAFQPFKRIASHHPCFFRWSTYTCYVQVQSHPFPQPSAQPCLTASDFSAGDANSRHSHGVDLTSMYPATGQKHWSPSRMTLAIKNHIK